jgi:hypothetical protein
MSKPCYAPVFRPHSFWACLMLTIVLAIWWAILAIFALFSEDARCAWKQLTFRLRYCRQGNDRTDREI